MATRKEFVNALRSQNGVRWQHQGRLPGVALDCAGLVVVAARMVGLEVQDQTTYDRRPDTAVLQGRISATGLKPVDRGSPFQVGDLLVVSYDNNPQHLAIITETEVGEPPIIIHGSAKDHRVVEHYLPDNLRGRVSQVWRFPFSDG